MGIARHPSKHAGMLKTLLLALTGAAAELPIRLEKECLPRPGLTSIPFV